MRGMLLLVWMIFCCVKLKAQEYRLLYDEQSLPELYTSIYLFAEVKQDGDYRKLSSGKYRLQTSEGALDGNRFTFNRQQLYDNDGIVHFNLITNNRNIPLTLQLPVLKEIIFNPYTDSIKPILNYYVNVEGKFSNGRVFPLDSTFITIQSDVGRMRGLEWVPPKERAFDRVNFTVINKFRREDRIHTTVYLKKYNDPRDDPNYQDRTEEEIINSRRRR